MVRNDTTATPTDLSDNAVEEISSNLRRLLADDICALRKDEELSLAHERAALSGLSPAAR